MSQVALVAVADRVPMAVWADTHRQAAAHTGLTLAAAHRGRTAVVAQADTDRAATAVARCPARCLDTPDIDLADSTPVDSAGWADLDTEDTR